MKKAKVIFVGDSLVGKTCLISQFVSNTFLDEHLLTIGSDKSIKDFTIEDTKFTFEIWDTVGQEKFRTANKIFMKNAKIAIFVIDITNKKSIDGLIYWYKEVKDHLELNDLITAIAANKSDLYEKKEINNEDIEEFIKNNKIDVFCETSALDHESVDNLFLKIGKKYIEKEKEKEKQKQKEKELKKNNNDEESHSENIVINNESQTKNPSKFQCCGKNK